MERTETVRVEFEATPGDARSVAILGSLPGIVLWLVAAPIAVAALSFVAILAPGGVQPMLPVLAFATVCGLSMTPLTTAMSVWWAGRRAVRELAGPRGCARRIEITQEGLVLTDESEERTLPWNAVHLIGTWRGSAFLLTSPVREPWALIEWQTAPRRVFDDDQHVRRFRDLARRYRREAKQTRAAPALPPSRAPHTTEPPAPRPRSRGVAALERALVFVALVGAVLSGWCVVISSVAVLLGRPGVFDVFMDMGGAALFSWGCLALLLVLLVAVLGYVAVDARRERLATARLAGAAESEQEPSGGGWASVSLPAGYALGAVLAFVGFAAAAVIASAAHEPGPELKSIGPDGSVFVASGKTLHAFRRDGTRSRVLELGGPPFRFAQIADAEAAPDGALYVIDQPSTGPIRVVKIDRAGRLVEAWSVTRGGAGWRGSARLALSSETTPSVLVTNREHVLRLASGRAEAVPLEDVQVSEPLDVCVASSRGLVIADTGNRRLVVKDESASTTVDCAAADPEHPFPIAVDSDDEGTVYALLARSIRGEEGESPLPADWGHLYAMGADEQTLRPIAPSGGGRSKDIQTFAALPERGFVGVLADLSTVVTSDDLGSVREWRQGDAGRWWQGKRARMRVKAAVSRWSCVFGALVPLVIGLLGAARASRREPA